VTWLPIIPVGVRGRGTGRIIGAYALLDSGSTTSFCTQKLADDIGVQGKAENLVINTLEKRGSVTTTSMVGLDVMDMDEQVLLEVPRVYTRKDLHISMHGIAEDADLEKWPHLQGVGVCRLKVHQVDLLLGQDVPLALTPKEIRNGGPGEPYAVRTVLG
jgi:hypothetical protein